MGTSGCLSEDISVKTDEDSKKKRIIGISRAKTNKEEVEIRNFRDKILDLHNELRKQHNSPKLILNNNINELAEEYAKELILGKMENFDKRIEYGENILFYNELNTKEIFKIWKAEENNYDFKENKFSKKSGHFTQIIWKSTKHIGVGYEYDKINKQYCVVVLYYPARNVHQYPPHDIAADCRFQGRNRVHRQTPAAREQASLQLE